MDKSKSVELHIHVHVHCMCMRSAGEILVSKAIRIFPRGAHARGKVGRGREVKIRLVRCARFSIRLPECWQGQSNLSIQSN